MQIKAKSPTKAILWIYILLHVLQVIHGYDLFSTSFAAKDPCKNICQDEKLPVLEPNNFENFVCQSGCRFFNIIKFNGGLEMIPATKRCHISCNESYSFPNEIKVCSKGCELMSSRAEIIALQNVLIRSAEDNSNDFILREPESDLLDTDLLSDPSIKSQLEIGFNIDYKIPETHIRTMPIDDKVETEKASQVIDDSGDWLDCASKNSGIPRWILVFIMLGTVMVALWLTLDNRKSHEDYEDGVLVEIPTDTVLMENFIIEKDPILLEKDSVEEGGKFMPPPKYSEIIEINNSLLPKYSELVENQNGEENV